MGLASNELILNQFKTIEMWTDSDYNAELSTIMVDKLLEHPDKKDLLWKCTVNHSATYGTKNSRMD